MKEIVLSDILNKVENMPTKITELGEFSAQAGGNITSSTNDPQVTVTTIDNGDKPQINFVFDYIKGAQGVQGRIGKDGKDGKDGPQGNQGAGIDIGTQGVIDSLADALSLKFLRIDNFDYGTQQGSTPFEVQGANFGNYVNFQGRSGCKDDNGNGSGDGGDGNVNINLNEYLKKGTSTNNNNERQDVHNEVYFYKGAFDSSSNSDIRYKTNISPINNVLDDVKKLDIINYTWSKPNDISLTSFGVSAQQLEELGGNFKQLVNEREDDKTKWVDYKKLSVIDLKAIQEQQKKIEELEQRISELENK